MGLTNYIRSAANSVSSGSSPAKPGQAPATAGTGGSAAAAGDDKIPEGASADDTECVLALSQCYHEHHTPRRACCEQGGTGATSFLPSELISMLTSRLPTRAERWTMRTRTVRWLVDLLTAAYERVPSARGLRRATRPDYGELRHSRSSLLGRACWDQDGSDGMQDLLERITDAIEREEEGRTSSPHVQSRRNIHGGMARVVAAARGKEIHDV